jgi:prepilin-type processing-associated H-X9-DG protein
MRSITKTQTASAGGAEGDQRAPRRNLRSKAGFTLTELLVLVAVGAVLTGLLVPDLSQAHLKLLQQACAANLKQWGIAFQMYSQDFNGWLFYCDSGAGIWDDTTVWVNQPNPYAKYFGASSKSQASVMIRRMRVCPAAPLTDHQIVDIGVHQYSLATPYVYNPHIGWMLVTGMPGVGWFVPIRIAGKPSQLLLLIDSGSDDGSVWHDYVYPGRLVSYTSPALQRHGGSVNALFADYHVENVTPQKLQEMDGAAGKPSIWFQLGTQIGYF